MAEADSAELPGAVEHLGVRLHVGYTVMVDVVHIQRSVLGMEVVDRSSFAQD
ncbi:hypothetical protein D3C73_1664990 [compost metagenome]